MAKDAALKQYYKAYNEALMALYGGESLRLAGDADNLYTFSADVINDAIKALHERGEFAHEMLDQVAGRGLIDENYRILSTAVERGVASAGISTEIPAELTAALKDNAFIFSGFKAYHTLNEAGVTLANSNGGLKSLDEFRKDAGEVFKKQGLNLTAEYQHAVQTAQMATQWANVEETGDRYDLQYRTAGDGKVRREHASLNGTTLPPSDPFWNSYYPPNGWGCRCNAVQVRKGKYPATDSAKAITAGNVATSKPSQQIFRTNAGQTRRVFPEKHPNFPKGCGDCTTLKLAKGGRPICDACRIITKQSAERTVKKREAEYTAYAPTWKREYFNKANGGFMVVDRRRMPTKSTSKNDVAKYNKEYSMCHTMAKGGYKIELLHERPGISSPDITINDMTADLKCTDSHNNISKYAKDAFDKKKAKAVIFQFDEETKKIHSELKACKAKGKEIYYYFTGRENKVFKL